MSSSKVRELEQQLRKAKEEESNRRASINQNFYPILKIIALIPKGSVYHEIRN